MSSTGALCPAEHERHSIGVDFTPSVPPRSTMAALGARNRGTCVPPEGALLATLEAGPHCARYASRRSPPTRSILPAFHRSRVMGGPRQQRPHSGAGAGGRTERQSEPDGVWERGKERGTDGEKGEQGVKGTEGRGGGRTIIK